MSHAAEWQELSQAFAEGRITFEVFEQLGTQLTKRQEFFAGQERKRAPRPKRRDRPAPDRTAHYAQAPAMLYADTRLNYTVVKLILKLKELARGRGQCTAYVAQLAEMIGMSHRQTQRAQNVAEEKGYIVITRIREGRINSANVYRLKEACFPAEGEGRRRPRRQDGEPRRRRSTRAARSPVGVTKTTPHEERSSIVTPSPLERGNRMKGAPLVAAQLVSPLTGPTVPPQGASMGAAQEPCHPGGVKIDIEEAIARAREGP